MVALAVSASNGAKVHLGSATVVLQWSRANRRADVVAVGDDRGRPSAR